MRTHRRLEEGTHGPGTRPVSDRSAERLERLAGIGLGVETVRTHTEQIGTALVERQRAAAAIVAETHEAAEPVDAAPELLVAEADGVQVRFQDGWHEAKVGEIAGCQLGNGLPDAELRSVEPSSPEAAEVLRVERGYFATNAARMAYPAFHTRGLPIGSGAVDNG